MRRRQIWAGLGDTVTITKPEPIKPTEKGYCKICKKYVGRGIYFHERVCK